MKEKHTLRSAFKRWLVLHNEEWRNTGYIRIPKWFSQYIRNNCNWDYFVPTKLLTCDKNYAFPVPPDKDKWRRTYKGFYLFEISDEELLDLQRAEWIKNTLEQ